MFESTGFKKLKVIVVKKNLSREFASHFGSTI